MLKKGIKLLLITFCINVVFCNTVIQAEVFVQKILPESEKENEVFIFAKNSSKNIFYDRDVDTKDLKDVEINIK